MNTKTYVLSRNLIEVLNQVFNNKISKKAPIFIEKYDENKEYSHRYYTCLDDEGQTLQKGFHLYNILGVDLINAKIYDLKNFIGTSNNDKNYWKGIKDKPAIKLKDIPTIASISVIISEWSGQNYLPLFMRGPNFNSAHLNLEHKKLFDKYHIHRKEKFTVV